MAWLIHIWWDDKDYTQYIHAFCAVETSCLHSLNGHHPYHLSYPWPWWDDCNYSYPSLIREGFLSQRPFSSRSAVPEINLHYVSIRRTKKNVSCKNINWLYFPRFVEAWDVLWCDIVSVLEIPTGPPVQGRQLWRRTGKFLLIFLQFYVYDLRSKVWEPTTFLTEFQTLHSFSGRNLTWWIRLENCLTNMFYHSMAAHSCVSGFVVHTRRQWCWQVQVLCPFGRWDPLH